MPVPVFDTFSHPNTEIPLPSNEHPVKIALGDARKALKQIDNDIFQTVVTSPPYWGLRDYGVTGQIGAETVLEDYIKDLVSVFEEVRRVLKPDGTFWLNLGNAYTSGGRTWRDSDEKNKGRGMSYRPDTPNGLKPKDLIGIPWMVALACQQNGWYLRSDIIWAKPNCQPESVKDRVTQSHEYLFMMTKSEKYFFDSKSIMEDLKNGKGKKNKRTVWNVNTEPYKGAHFAVFPRELVRPCILAGSKAGDTILDPFFGSGTVGVVSLETGRKCLGIELKPDYIELAQTRLDNVQAQILH